MAPMPASPLRCLSLLLLLAQASASVPTPSSLSGAYDDENKPRPSNTYIVHTDHLAKPSHFSALDRWYTSMVASLSPATDISRVSYVYDTAMHGFAAELTDDEARRLSNTPGVVGVYEDRPVHLHTTRSPGFLGLDEDFGIWPDTDFGDGVIIGFVDSGIWPESASFDDSGLGPVRSSWKGRCVDGERFNASTCNNKLVGARFFTAGGTSAARGDDFLSPRDKAGHGTHVASTAAGSEVANAGLFGFARGAARGVAPRARVAMYKACDVRGCKSAGIVAAIDAAVKDGVDILSLSLGGFNDPDFYKDSMSIALFGAVRAGVFVACSAGNFGPRESTLNNVAPWITTVGAGTVDRVFPVSITLGDGQVLTGQSLYSHAGNGTGTVRLLPSNCADDLEPGRIRGKLVVCTRDFGVLPSYGVAVKSAGGRGLISVDPMDWRMDGLMAQAFTLPAVTLSAREADKLTAYMQSDAYAVASMSFTRRTVTGENRAPMVASFSSRGPNHIVREILKPDVIAPGANILGAWPVESPLNHGGGDARRAGFNIMSGTSMACPHVAGVAALLRHKHRDWTPAMIRSALMTTAATLDSHGRDIADNSPTSGGAATPMVAGAGHVRPQLALDPGLVYDAVEEDYVDFLCALNYTAAQIRTFVPGFAGCARTLPVGAAGLNYPSFVVEFSNGADVRVLTRTVTKESEGPEAYTVRVMAPNRLVAVTVTPSTLKFDEQNEKKTYKVVFRSKKSAVGLTQFGHIVWENDLHRVRSPVEFHWIGSDALMTSQDRPN